MVNADDNTRLHQFKKMSHTLTRGKKIDPEKQLKQIAEDFKYYNTKIIELCKAHNDTELEKTIEKIINLFAKRCSIQLAQEQETLGERDTETRDEHITRYSAQCARFLNTVEALRNSYATRV